MVTGGLDGRCILWDLVMHDGTDPPGARIEVPFASPVLQVVMHPRRKYGPWPLALDRKASRADSNVCMYLALPLRLVAAGATLSCARSTSHPSILAYGYRRSRGASQ